MVALAEVVVAKEYNAKAIREAERQLMDQKFGPRVRTFETGATRDADTNKYDYEGFLSPLVLVRFAQYMHKHRVQSDGALRDSDNWQRGIPPAQYMKSLWRHFMDLWRAHRGYSTVDAEEALCGILFNTMGYLHELLKKRTGGVA